MNCLNCCVPESKIKKQPKINREEILEKGKEILKYTNPCASNENILSNCISPFRFKRNQSNLSDVKQGSIDECLKLRTNFRKFIPQTSKNIRDDIPIVKNVMMSNIPQTTKNVSGENIPIFSNLNKMMTKQRFSLMNPNSLITFLQNRNNNETDIIRDVSIKKSHWEKRDRFKCLFCGGARCKHENYLNNSMSVIKGLHSDFITDEIVASQRPSTVLINKFNLVQTFKEMNIGLIVNVQREGEHPYCGPNLKLEDSGFTYNPHVFLSGDIKCKVSGWKDMSVPESVNFMIEIVKDMCIYIKEKQKKVLVHCHAGYGRTGVVIACYMLYTSSKTVKKIVKEIRRVRPGCIEKQDQHDFCTKFQDYITKARTLYNLDQKEDNKKPIEYFIKYQKDLLYGKESEKLENVPKLLYKTLERLLQLKTKYNIIDRDFYSSFCKSMEEWNNLHEEVLTMLKIALNRGEYEILLDTENIEILSHLLFDWLEDDVEFLVNPSNISEIMSDLELKIKLEENINYNYSSYLRELKKETVNMMVENVKNKFKNVEFETTLEIANFFKNIYPDSQEDQCDFIDAIDRICVPILGYKYSDAYNIGSPNFEIISTNVTNLANIIRLFIVFIKIESNNGTKIKSFRQNKLGSNNNIKSILKNLNKSQKSEKINMTLLDSSDISSSSHSREISVSNKNNNSSYEIIKLHDANIEHKEKFLYKLHKSLKNYFSDDKKINHPKFNLKQLKDISEDIKDTSKISDLSNIEDNVIVDYIKSCLNNKNKPGTHLDLKFENEKNKSHLRMTTGHFYNEERKSNHYFHHKENKFNKYGQAISHRNHLKENISLGGNLLDRGNLSNNENIDYDNDTSFYGINNIIKTSDKSANFNNHPNEVFHSGNINGREIFNDS